MRKPCLGTVDNKAVKGFSQAANIYFNKPFSALDKSEYLALVAMLIAPDGYSVKNHPEKNRARVLRILNVLDGSYQPVDFNDVYYNLAG